MLGLIAQHADVWNTAWFGVPGPKFDEQRDAFAAACEKHGRSVEISVGMYIKADDAEPDAPGVAATTDAIAEAFAGWRERGVDEVLCWADPPTAKRLDAVAEALPS
jgi:alkanesulfonate monooxygenase SsuD/methylene tetrahydromethanopterin reductase-like flavin-dependent oxidoreductase (luciferase family)